VEVEPFEAAYAQQLRPWRLGATMFSVFGGLALLVAALGLYSVLAFGVAQRRYEMGIRSALGATRGRIVRMVMGEALGLAVAGLAVGCALALWTASRMEGLLYQVAPTDPLVFGGVVAVLLGAAVLAGLLPARRAVRVDPSESLRAE
jgi:ABC-type antimicrobial peptide transport system permease subunit